MEPRFKTFLTTELIRQLRTLKGDQQPNFGLMTAHHMVEHLIYVTKSLMKRKGEPINEPSKRQQFFQKFVAAGCPFEYRPRKDAQLNELRTTTIGEAITILASSIEKFYDLFNTHPTYKSYNAMTGAFTLAQLELFYYQHGRWHLYQFGLLTDFAAYIPDEGA